MKRRVSRTAKGSQTPRGSQHFAGRARRAALGPEEEAKVLQEELALLAAKRKEQEEEQAEEGKGKGKDRRKKAI